MEHTIRNRNKIRLKGVAALLTAAVMISGCFTAGTDAVWAASGGGDEYMTIGLKYGSNSPSQCVLKSSSGFQIVNITGDGPEDTLPLPAYDQLIAMAENGTVILRDKNGTTLVSDLGATGAVMPMDYQDGNGKINCDGTEYRDGIRLMANSGQTMNVINYITMDHYLYGVIHAEMSQSYPLEALKAQAVVARSYASLNKHAHKEYGFDACATTHCQVYKGAANEYPKTTQAVEETSGELLYSGGKVVQAYYFKNSGGHTQNSEDVWSSAEDYLRGVADPYSPDYPWTAQLTFSQLKTQLESAKYNPGTIQSVAITGRNSAGAVSEVTIKGSSGTVMLKKESVRTVLGANTIKSTMFDFVNGTSSSGTGGTGSGELYAAGSKSTAKAGSNLYVVSSAGTQKKLDSAGLYVSNGTKTVKGSESGSSSNGQSVTTVTDGTVNIAGKGYGHGIGMPQDSAIKMAEQGADYEEILEFFFSGIEIR